MRYTDVNFWSADGEKKDDSSAPFDVRLFRMVIDTCSTRVD